MAAKKAGFSEEAKVVAAAVIIAVVGVGAGAVADVAAGMKTTKVCRFTPPASFRNVAETCCLLLVACGQQMQGAKFEQHHMRCLHLKRSAA